MLNKRLEGTDVLRRLNEGIRKSLSVIVGLRERLGAFVLRVLSLVTCLGSMFTMHLGGAVMKHHVDVDYD